MIAAPEIELATFADIAAMGRMRAELGWHRSEPLLSSALEWERGRIFIVRARSLGAAHGEAGQALAATTSAIAAGPVGVIGNVGVRPAFQRRGLGKLLTAHAIAWQRSQGVHNVWLDATPSGRPLYRQLGFTDVTSSWDVHALLRDLREDHLVALSDGYVAEPCEPQALTHIAELDRVAFGGDRLGLLLALARQPECQVYIAHAVTDETRRSLGYAITRRLESPYIGLRMGPLVAPSDAVAAALTLAALRAERQQHANDIERGASYFVAGGGDMPHARAFFDAIGATTHDDDLVMRLALGADKHDNGASPASKTAESSSQSQLLYSWSSPMLF